MENKGFVEVVNLLNKYFIETAKHGRISFPLRRQKETYDIYIFIYFYFYFRNRYILVLIFDI